MLLKVCRQEKSGKNEKHLLILEDNTVIEIGIFPHNSSLHLCLSTLAGCPVGCIHCATTYSQPHFIRNLTPNELCEEIEYGLDVASKSFSGLPVTVSFSGHGEPFLNSEALIKAVKHATKLHIDDMYVTTVGINDSTKTLLQIPAIKLFISLHGSNDFERNIVIPSSNIMASVSKIVEITNLHQTNNGRVVWNYMMTKTNTSEHSAQRLCDLAGKTEKHIEIRLTQYVDIGYTTPIKASDKSDINSFLSILAAHQNHGKKFSYRLSKIEGADLGIACGQLRSSFM